MSETASVTLGIAARYATAIFELAKDAKQLGDIEKDLDALSAALSDSPDLSDLISSPVYSRDDQVNAITAIAQKMKLSGPLTKALGLMASNRRLFVLPQLIDAIKSRLAEEKGEVTAQVTVAKALSKAQQEKLAKSLKATTGKDVKINMAVDESLIGGLIVKVGSQMIDSSVRSRLSNLKNAMKEVR